RRFTLRQTAIRGDEGSRGSRYARSTHFARPTVPSDGVTTVTYSTQCPFHTTGSMDNRRHAPGTRLALWLRGARLLSRAHPSDVEARGGPARSSCADLALDLLMSAPVVRGRLLFGLVLASFVVAPSLHAGGSLPLRVVARVPLSGPAVRFDYTSFDPKTK